MLSSLPLRFFVALRRRQHWRDNGATTTGAHPGASKRSTDVGGEVLRSFAFFWRGGVWGVTMSLTSKGTRNAAVPRVMCRRDSLVSPGAEGDAKQPEEDSESVKSETMKA